MINAKQNNQSVVSCMFCKKKLKDCNCQLDIPLRRNSNE